MSDAEGPSADSPQTERLPEGTEKHPLRRDSTSSTRTYSTRSSQSGPPSDATTPANDGRKPSASTGITVVTADSSSDRAPRPEAVSSPRPSAAFSAPPADGAPSEHRVPNPPLSVGVQDTRGAAGDGQGRRPDLAEHQRKWLLDREFIQEHGYDLPRRYRAGYVPPGISSNADAADDVLSTTHPGLIDATRRADGVHVVLKRIATPAAAHALSCVQRFNDVRRVRAPDNHCVRMYDVLLPPRATAVLVTPHLRRWDAPPLQTVGEAAALFAQLAEGLRYMHRHNTAYNANLASSTLYGPAHMPWRTGPKYGRSRARDPPKYYLCNFSHARTFVDVPVPAHTDQPVDLSAVHDGAAQTQGERAAEPDPSPFAQDVYNLAEFFTQEFTLRYNHLTWLEPLLAAMLAPDPRARPELDAVIARFASARRGLPWRTLRSRLVPTHTHTPTHPHTPARAVEAARTLRHVVRSVGGLVCGVSSAPRAYCEREVDMERERLKVREKLSSGGGGGSGGKRRV